MMSNNDKEKESEKNLVKDMECASCENMFKSCRKERGKQCNWYKERKKK